MSSYRLISSVTLTSPASIITISSIPQNFKHLIVKLHTISSSDDTDNFRINGSTNDYYSFVNQQGNFDWSRPTDRGRINLSSFTLRTNTLLFPDYTSGALHRHALIYGVNAGVTNSIVRWASTAAITQLQFLGSSQNYATNTRVDLYGLEA